MTPNCPRCLDFGLVCERCLDNEKCHCIEPLPPFKPCPHCELLRRRWRVIKGGLA